MKKILLIFPLVFLFSLFFVHATISCNLTVPTVVNSGTALNVSYNISGAQSDVNVSVFIEARSASTRNSSYSFVANVTNTSNLRHTNFTFTTSLTTLIIEDSNDYDFRATCYLNQSGVSTIGGTADTVTTSSTLSDRTIDRTTPTVPASITYTNPVQRANTITSTINLNNTNRCWIRFGSSNVERRTMAISGSGDLRTCTFTVGRNSPPNSDYASYLSADDRSNETLSTSRNIVIRGTTSDGGGLLGDTIVTQTDGFEKQSPFSKVDNKSIAVILVLILLFLYFKNKK